MFEPLTDRSLGLADGRRLAFDWAEMLSAVIGATD